MAFLAAAPVQDPIELFQSLAYTRELPSRLKPAKVFRLFQVTPQGDRPIEPGALLQFSDRFQFEVLPPFDGYVYLFADGGEPSVIYPRGNETNQLRRGQPWRIPRRLAFEPGPDDSITLLMVLVRMPLAQAGELTFEQVKQALANMEATSRVFEENSIRIASLQPKVPPAR